MKKNDKKEIKYLNVCMDKALHEELIGQKHIQLTNKDLSTEICSAGLFT